MEDYFPNQIPERIKFSVTHCLMFLKVNSKTQQKSLIGQNHCLSKYMLWLLDRFLNLTDPSTVQDKYDALLSG